MTLTLKEKITRVRTALEADPMGFIAGEIRAPALEAPRVIGPPWSSFGNFLAETNGGRFGSIDVWSLEEFRDKQYQSVNFSGGQERWLVIGQLLYEPLVMENGTDHLFLFQGDREKLGLDFGKFDEFFIEAVFGPRYAKIVPNGEKDEWWDILKFAGLR